MGQKIKRLFIANRGEILRRIALSAKKGNIAVIAIKDAKKKPPQFLEGLVDQFINIENENTKTYLDIPLLISLMKDTNCDAVHPGFGFLSENADFAKEVIKNKINWIGPSPEAITKMAHKGEAKTIAERAGVPVLPGMPGVNPINDKNALKDIHAFANKCGFPILIKAALGGGGKGMRICRNESELDEAAQRAASEAQNSFGDGSLILEKYLENPRHIEVQVFGDKFGEVAIFGDRDCSMQRRHQKIIEEAPVPNLADSIRQELHKAAQDLAKAVKYEGAGTVEFLLDTKNLKDIYFLEMNTRLQVEHPVTEQVFGVDLVALQLHIAEGNPLDPELTRRHPNGHSIEVRLYAEDCEADFFPSAGAVYGAVFPSGSHIRVEQGIDSVDEISSSFDPMFGKIITTGTNRSQAIQQMIWALKNTFVPGPKTNIRFLIDLLQNKSFINEKLSTALIAQEKTKLNQDEKNEKKNYSKLVETIFSFLEQMQIPPVSASASIFEKTIGNAFFQNPSTLTLNETTPITITVSTPFPYGIFGRGIVNLDKISFLFSCVKTNQGTRIFLNIDGYNFEKRIDRNNYEFSTTGEESSAKKALTAPVNGKVISIHCRENDQIQLQQTLLIIESMKMQFEIKSNTLGVLKKLYVKQGDQVDAGKKLVDLGEA